MKNTYLFGLESGRTPQQDPQQPVDDPSQVNPKPLNTDDVDTKQNPIPDANKQPQHKSKS